MDSLSCVACAVPIPRNPTGLMAFRCPECCAAKDWEQQVELNAATAEGERRTRYRAWQDRLFTDHRNGRHKTYSTPGCEPCEIARKVNAVVPEESDVPRALR